MSIPIVCETEGCSNRGELINRISEIAPENVEIFLEDYSRTNGPEPEDYCPVCGEAGIAQDPEPEE